MMAALEAAGFDPSPAASEPSVFRAQVRKDLSELDPDLRGRLRAFYERNKLPAPASAADQAARYVSLAFALSPPPSLEAPARSEDLPGSLLEVLDFAPLVKEFYRRSGIDEKLVSYTRAYQAEGDRLRKPTSEMVRAILSYLHTRPITISLERIRVKTPGKKKGLVSQTTREHERHFLIVPDLLGAPGAINFRVIGDEYYAVLPEGTDPASSELRRGYVQYVIDPLLVRFNRAIAERRDQIKQVLAEREKAGATVTPDVFVADAHTQRLVHLHNDASGLTNLARNIGGSVGTAFLVTVLARRAQFHQNQLASHLTGSSIPLQNEALTMSRYLHDRGGMAYSLMQGRLMAQGTVMRQLIIHSTMLAYLDVIKCFAIAICQWHATVDLLLEYAILDNQVYIAKAEIVVHRLGDRPQQLFPAHASFYPCHSVLH